jgi:hypothetical protein
VNVKFQEFFTSMSWRKENHFLQFTDEVVFLMLSCGTALQINRLKNNSKERENKMRLTRRNLLQTEKATDKKLMFYESLFTVIHTSLIAFSRQTE